MSFSFLISCKDTNSAELTNWLQIFMKYYLWIYMKIFRWIKVHIYNGVTYVIELLPMLMIMILPMFTNTYWKCGGSYSFRRDLYA